MPEAPCTKIIIAATCLSLSWIGGVTVVLIPPSAAAVAEATVAAKGSGDGFPAPLRWQRRGRGGRDGGRPAVTTVQQWNGPLLSSCIPDGAVAQLTSLRTKVRRPKTPPTKTIAPETNTTGSSWSEKSQSTVVVDKGVADKSVVTTHVGKVAEAFESVLVVGKRRGGGLPVVEIDSSRLLSAATAFESYVAGTGQSMAAREIEKNRRKTERLYRSAPVDVRRDLWSLLEYEKASGIHKPGGLLKDPSGAVGSLWLRRSVAFQCRLYECLILEQDGSDGDDDSRERSAKAAWSAYQRELEPYHGWPLRRINKVALGTLPPKRELMAAAGGFAGASAVSQQEEIALRQDVRKLVSTVDPLLREWKRIHVDLDLEDYCRH